MANMDTSSTGVIKSIIAEDGVMLKDLAEKLGYSTSSGLSGRLSSRQIGSNKLVEILNALGYELIVRKAGEHNGKEWVITE